MAIGTCVLASLFSDFRDRCLLIRVDGLKEHFSLLVLKWRQNESLEKQNITTHRLQHQHSVPGGEFLSADNSTRPGP